MHHMVLVIVMRDLGSKVLCARSRVQELPFRAFGLHPAFVNPNRVLWEDFNKTLQCLLHRPTASMTTS
jgi:hypothetical protein